MNVHPSEDQQRLQPGYVLRVYPDEWAVDVRLAHNFGGIIHRARVYGQYLPEVHTEDRPSQVAVGWLDGNSQAPVCVPLHNTLVPLADRANHIFWSEHLSYVFRITRDGVLEIRNTAGPLLHVRILEKDGVVELRTPNTSAVLKDADGSIALKCSGDVKVDAGGNVDLKAGASAMVEAQTLARIKAPAIILDGEVTITKNLVVTQDIAAQKIIDASGNTNHHSH